MTSRIVDFRNERLCALPYLQIRLVVNHWVKDEGIKKERIEMTTKRNRNVFRCYFDNRNNNELVVLLYETRGYLRGCHKKSFC